MVLRLVDGADVLLEGFRPGVAERLGFGPEACLERNPRLVYGRITGWGQEGPLAARAGHDIDYLAVAGALHPIGRAGRPADPAAEPGGRLRGRGHAVGAGGARRPVGAAALRAGPGGGRRHGGRLGPALRHVPRDARRRGVERRARAPTCSTPGPRSTTATRPPTGASWRWGRWSRSSSWPCSPAWGSTRTSLPFQYDRDGWPVLRERLAAAFRTRTRDEWEQVFAEPRRLRGARPDDGRGRRAIPTTPARGTFVEVGGVVQPGPAPRFDRTPAGSADPAGPRRGAHGRGAGPVRVRRGRDRRPPGGRGDRVRRGALAPGGLSRRRRPTRASRRSDGAGGAGESSPARRGSHPGGPCRPVGGGSPGPHAPVPTGTTAMTRWARGRDSSFLMSLSAGLLPAPL